MNIQIQIRLIINELVGSLHLPWRYKMDLNFNIEILISALSFTLIVLFEKSRICSAITLIRRGGNW